MVYIAASFIDINVDLSVYVCSKQFVGWEGFLRSHHGQCSVKFYRQICIQNISARAPKKVKYKNSCTVSKLCPHAEESSSSSSSDSFLVPVFAANFLFHPSIPFFSLSAVLRILGVLGLSVAGSGFRFLGVEGVDPETEFLTVFRIFAMRSLIARVVGTSLSFAIILSKRKPKTAVRKWTYARHRYDIKPLSVTDFLQKVINKSKRWLLPHRILSALTATSCVSRSFMKS